MTKLVGYQRGTGRKTGKPYCKAFVTEDKVPGVEGLKASEMFMPDDLIDLFKPADVGKELVLKYNISYGRAYLADVVVKN